ncbi:MAG TPA: BatD family protein [Thermoanaerobaculia bacterium]|nr:BatD family protein [Thermoanaerobaculia bacterium]
MVRRVLLPSALCLLPFVVLANDLSVDRRTLRAGETVTITVSLEDAFASIDDLDIPVKNLVVIANPSVSSEFSWINGTVVRRKIFRFVARAAGPGPALVGPLTITLPDGERESFAPVALQILPDRAAGSNDPVAVLRELLATGRDPFFVVAEADKSEAYVGEQVVVTWWLFNGASVQEWQIGGVPKLAEFWVEEVDVRSAQPTQSFVGDYALQRMPIRRVALFPLKSGTLQIGSMEVEATVMRRTSGGPFGLFEGNVVDVGFSSAPLTVNVRPLPAAAAGAIVGDVKLNCSTPRQRNGGPVVMDASLTGRGNLRAAAAPQFESPPQANVQLVDRGTALDRATAVPSMTRRWQYLLFPDRAGELMVPAVTSAIFLPATGERQVLRCAGATLTVSAARAELSSSPRRSEPAARPLAPVAIAAAALLLAISGVMFKRHRALSRDVGQIVTDASPAAVREAVNLRLVKDGIDPAALLHETSDRGDAYRSLRSLLDGLETERIRIGDPDDEIRRRVRDLLVA